MIAVLLPAPSTNRQQTKTVSTTVWKADKPIFFFLKESFQIFKSGEYFSTEDGAQILSNN
jgi:hypothetical protein